MKKKQMKKSIYIIVTVLCLSFFVQATELETPMLEEQLPLLQTTEAEKISQEQDQTDEILNNQEEQKEELPSQLDELQPKLPPPKGESSTTSFADSTGPNWDVVCNDIVCEHIIYPYQKYYYTNEFWQELDENFYSTPCKSNHDFCATDNLYEMHMKLYADNTLPARFEYDNMILRFAPKSIAYSYQQEHQHLANIKRSPAQVTDSKATYPAAFLNDWNLHFRYTPRAFKEELVIENKEALPDMTVSENNKDVTLDVVFTFDMNAATKILVEGEQWNRKTPITTRNTITFTEGTSNFYLTPPFAYDSKRNGVKANYVLENKGEGYSLTIQVPYSWLINKSRTYPVVIDPTITLDDTNLNWDGDIDHDENTACLDPPPPGGCGDPFRIGTDIQIYVGDFDNAQIGNNGFITYRGDLDWNLTSVPDRATIIDVNLTLEMTSQGTGNDNLQFYHMHGGNTHYADNDSGNWGFFYDAGNGTQYLNQTVSFGINTFNLTSSAQLVTDLQQLLSNGTDEWSIGMKSEETRQTNNADNRYASSEATGPATRPSLKITYKVIANETEGRDAIEAGIMNILGNATTINTDQQVYTRTVADVQQLASFDKFTLNGTKRWSINYITAGEEYANMTNLSNNVYFLEMTSLSTDEITAEVEAFINGTL